MKKSIFHKRLTECLSNKSISQAMLAKFLRTTQQTVSRWCNGSCEPDFDTLMLICGYLGESVDYLLGYDEKLCTQYAISNLRDIVGSDKKFQKEQSELIDQMRKRKESPKEIQSAINELFTEYCKVYCDKFGIILQ